MKKATQIQPWNNRRFSTDLAVKLPMFLGTILAWSWCFQDGNFSNISNNFYKFCKKAKRMEFLAWRIATIFWHFWALQNRHFGAKPPQLEAVALLWLEISILIIIAHYSKCWAINCYQMVDSFTKVVYCSMDKRFNINMWDWEKIFITLTALFSWIPLFILTKITQGFGKSNSRILAKIIQAFSENNSSILVK